MKPLAVQASAQPTQKSTVVVSEAQAAEWRQRALQALHTTFGYSAFRGQQERAIIAACTGRDAFVLMPTGGGKSLCYTIPALLSPGRLVLVVSPLIALMQDQVAALRKRGIGADLLSSSQSESERGRVYFHLEALAGSRGREGAGGAGGLQMLYVTPELIATHRFKTNTLAQLYTAGRLALFAIDEAHAISSWGHQFRPSYRALHVLRQQFPRVPIMALTATADPKVSQDITTQLRLREPLLLTSSFNRPNITYSVTLLDVPLIEGAAEGELQGGGAGEEGGRTVGDLQRLLRLIQAHVGRGGGPGCAIVYVLKRQDADQLVTSLKAAGPSSLRCAVYHAGLGSAKRSQVLELWMAGQLDVVAATVAFGMGVDRADVRLVVHWNLPATVEGYYQESGRAGRDGAPAHAALFYRTQDRELLDFILRKEAEAARRKQQQNKGGPAVGGVGALVDGSGSHADPGHAQRAFGKVAEYCLRAECRRAFLLAHFGETLPAGHRCEGCDLCDDAQRTRAARAQLELLAAQRGLRRSGGAVYGGRGGAARIGAPGAPEGTYGLDQGAYYEDDKGGGGDEDVELYGRGAVAWDGLSDGEGSDGAAIPEHMRKRGREEEGEDGEGGEAAARAAAFAAEAAQRAAAKKAQYGHRSGGNDSTSAFLDEMQRREAAFERSQGGSAGGVANLLGRPGQGNQGSNKPAASTAVDQSMRDAAVGLLTKALQGNTAAVNGLGAAVVQGVAGLCEAVAHGEAGESRNIYRSVIANTKSRCASVTSVFSLPPVQQVLCRKGTPAGKQQLGPAASHAAGQPTLQGLLTAEVQAVNQLVESSLAHGAPIAPATVERVRAWGDVPVTVELLQAGLGLTVRGLSKRKEAGVEGVAAAAAQVVAAWKAQISQQGRK